jgi:hypothetical protein
MTTMSRRTDGGLGLALLLVILLVIGCTRQPSSPTPTIVLPTPVPAPSQNAAALTREDTSDVEVAFRTEVQQVVQQARFLSNAPCDRLTDAMKQDSTLVDSLENYAALLRTTSTQDQALDLPDMPAVLKRMDDAIADLNDKIASCSFTRR